jgi:membrane protease YdiL (CAAX protease family)
MGVIFFLGFILVFIYQKQYWHDMEVNSEFLPLMLAESMAWATGLYFFMSNVYILLMNPNGSILIQQVTLAVGAGIYEEILFRVLLIAAIGSILGFIFQWSDMLKNWVAMIIAAGIFSSFHFIGEYGDYFSFNIFMVRFFAGILLGILYFMRGFGITAWTHAIYDLIILTRITMK